MGQYMGWLADAARLTGYPVTEMRGWRGHNHGPMADRIYGVVCHHTAGAEPPRAADFPTIGVVRDGRAGLPGPLAQYGLGFSGRIYVISDGLAYHAGSGSWRGVAGNSRMIGIEAEDSGDGDWTPEQLDSYPRLVAAIHLYLATDAGWCCAHREWTPRKPDPAGIDMPDFRVRVARYLANPASIHRDWQPPSEEDIMASLDDLRRVLDEKVMWAEQPRRGASQDPNTTTSLAAILRWWDEAQVQDRQATIDAEKRIMARLDEIEARLDAGGGESPKAT